MDIDNIIDAVNDAVEILKEYREMLETGNCNTCKVERSCQYCPEKGELVRVNCPLYVKPEGGVVKVITPERKEGADYKEKALRNNENKF